MDENFAEKVVDEIVAGAPPSELRVLHAKGALCTATFTPTAEAASLSRAAHLAGPPLRAHVRFSNGSGVVGADYAPREGRGMVVKIYLADGTTTDIVAVSLPAFFVRTPEDFLEFVRARRPDPGTGEPDPEKIGAFVTEHPESLAALGAVLSTLPTDSYLSCEYNALHTFLFEDSAGTVRPGRYHLEPVTGTAAISAEDANGRDADHLQDDLRQRLESGPAVFAVSVSLANGDDVLDDP